MNIREAEMLDFLSFADGQTSVLMDIEWDLKRMDLDTTFGVAPNGDLIVEWIDGGRKYNLILRRKTGTLCIHVFSIARNGIKIDNKWWKDACVDDFFSYYDNNTSQ